MASRLLRPSRPPPFTWWALPSPCPLQILLFPSFWNPQWPSSQTQARASPPCKALSSSPQFSPSSPPGTSTPSVGGGGVGKGRSREGGRGDKNSKATTKNRIKKEERKKKQQPKSEKLSGADSTRKEKKKNDNKKPKTKNQKDPFFGKKEKKKKVLCIFFSKFCGETSRYWALFSKISKFFNSLQMFAFSASDRLLKIVGLFLTFQLCHQFANLNFFFQCSFAPN